MKVIDHAAPPVLPAYELDDQINVWCRYCGRWHIHGPDDDNRPRAAHCDSADSEYSSTGYTLEMRPLTPAIERAIQHDMAP